MNHLPHLITDLALILGVAAIITMLFKWLKQPLILGYIIAGMIISPNFNFFPSIYEVGNVQVWAEIGVIFLLFGLGLEFSFKKLVQIGGSASVAAGSEAVGMGLLGFITGRLLQWPFMDCIFLGAALTVSSSTIVIKTFEELGLKQKKFAGLVYGILVVEDLIAVTILVLLGSFAVSQQFDGGSVLAAIVKLLFFMILWFLTGIFLIPTLLKIARRFLTDEILLIVAIGLCLAMVCLSTYAGFSAALGAFIMGSLLAETTKAEQIEHLLKPVKDLFGAIFFVSVGMLINLHVLGTYIVPIAVITLICLIGKPLVLGLGTYLSGNGLKVSLQTGMSLALIGEFSFIIAALGNNLKVISDHFYPVIIAVSAITTFISPYLNRLSLPFYNYLSRKVPRRWQRLAHRYSAQASSVSAVSDWTKVMHTFIINCIIFSVLLSAIILVTITYLIPWLTKGNYGLGGFTATVLSLTAMAPFIWALAVRNEKTAQFARIYAQGRYIGPIWIMRVIKLALALLFISLLVTSIFSKTIALYTVIAIVILISIFRHRLQQLYDGIEDRFIKNLNDREITAQQDRANWLAARRNATLAPWDAHMTTFDVPVEAVHITGQTLEALQWRERIGVNVAMIRRGQLAIITPGKADRIYPGDRLYIICTDSQEKRMNAILRPDKKAIKTLAGAEIELDKFIIDHDSRFLHKTIRDSGIRAKTHGLVVGLERKGKRMLNPDSTLIFEDGDVVWIVGERKLINKTLEEEEGK